jgi:glyoxylase-like metal-dependent hydrolase (beta-lactamase superfamily II)
VTLGKRIEQFPGLYRRRIGEAVVTLVNDGYLDIPFDILRGVERLELERLMRNAFRPGAPRLSVNAFVIETQDRTILVDAGGGSTTTHSMGLLARNLALAGIKPSDIDTVLLTHIHPDHSNGLLAAEGKAIFPGIEVIVHEDDIRFWSEPRLNGEWSEAAKPYIDSAQRMLSCYRGQLRPSREGEVMPGVTLVPLPGHTPGHSGYRLDSGGESLLIWGDTVHVPEIQIPQPNVTNMYDIDPPLAAEMRSKLFDMVATTGLLVAGMHLHIPGFAHLVREAGQYRLVPESWHVAI